VREGDSHVGRSENDEQNNIITSSLWTVNVITPVSLAGCDNATECNREVSTSLIRRKERRRHISRTNLQVEGRVARRIFFTGFRMVSERERELTAFSRGRHVASPFHRSLRTGLRGSVGHVSSSCEDSVTTTI